jgi:hypothetical protein
MHKLNSPIKFLKKIIFLLLIIFCEIGNAHEGHNHGPSVAASVSFDKLGNLWRVKEQQGYVVVDSSNDQGAHFSGSVKVNTEMQQIGTSLGKECAN